MLLYRRRALTKELYVSLKERPCIERLFHVNYFAEVFRPADKTLSAESITMECIGMLKASF